MRDYSGNYEFEQFHSIQEICELLDLDRDKLRFMCLRSMTFPVVNEYGVLGFEERGSRRLTCNQCFEERLRLEENPWE